jgi:hypothetical protein
LTPNAVDWDATIRDRRPEQMWNEVYARQITSLVVSTTVAQ